MDLTGNGTFTPNPNVPKRRTLTTWTPSRIKHNGAGTSIRVMSRLDEPFGNFSYANNSDGNPSMVLGLRRQRQQRMFVAAPLRSRKATLLFEGIDVLATRRCRVRPQTDMPVLYGYVHRVE
jgi:hypothetical protein